MKIASRFLMIFVRFLITGLFIGRFANFPFGRYLLPKYPEFFSTGLFSSAGPTEGEVKSASFKMWFVGHGYNDATRVSERGSKPDKEVITKVSGPEVWYITTPIILVQCTLVLLSQRGILPKGGV